jgi:hypothetical protein
MKPVYKNYIQVVTRHSSIVTFLGMKPYILLLILSLLATTNVCGQDIAFDYDADGNMEFRYVLTLKSPAAPTKEDDAVTIEFSGQKISIYPNPTQGKITVSFASLDTEKENVMHLYDMSGKLIKSQKIVSMQNELEITGAPGIYLLTIHSGEAVSKWKIIKQ